MNYYQNQNQEVMMLGFLVVLIIGYLLYTQSRNTTVNVPTPPVKAPIKTQPAIITKVVTTPYSYYDQPWHYGRGLNGYYRTYGRAGRRWGGRHHRGRRHIGRHSGRRGKH